MIVKSGRRICGTGAALANAPLVQDKSYFEVKIQCGGLLFVHVYTCIYTYMYVHVHIHMYTLYMYMHVHVLLFLGWVCLSLFARIKFCEFANA